MQKNSAIEVYLRVRPTKNLHEGLKLDEENNKIQVFKQKKEGQIVNNTQEHYEFPFKGILNMEIKQNDVFNQVAKDACDSALEGYNSTIFTYGQTGSGKTYTMSGQPESVASKGLIPRSVEYLFKEFKKKEDTRFEIQLSYIEIYEGSGYDLLYENRNENTDIKNLPKVQAMETEQEEVILKNLSIHKAETVDDAMNLLFIGDTNKIMCETTSNDVSSRSHQSRKLNSDIKTISRIHLVDLAGSERIGKTQVEGQNQRTAIGINLALHNLELVIVTLNRRINGEECYIPYRNSLLTMLLKNSLGGNCKTIMIANVNGETTHLEETLSTCKFAGRVASIKNFVVRNEQLDPSVIIARLKRENAELKAEINMLKGNSKESLEQDDVEKCRQKVKDFLDTRDPSQTLVCDDRLELNECFFFMKHLLNNQYKNGIKNIDTNIQNGVQKEDQQGSDLQKEEIRRLKIIIQQRDYEIQNFLKLLTKNHNNQQFSSNKENQQQIVSQQFQIQQNNTNGDQNEILKANQNYNQSKIINFNEPKEEYNLNQNENVQVEKKRHQRSDMSTKVSLNSMNLQSQDFNNILDQPITLSNDQLMDRSKCFDLFRKQYRKSQVQEENYKKFKEMCEEGKKHGELVKESRRKIENYKNQIEKIRQQNALMGLTNQQDKVDQEEEQNLINLINNEKQIYIYNCSILKDLKCDIENIQRLMDKNKEKLQQDFDRWHQKMRQQTIQYNNQSQITNTITNNNQLNQSIQAIKNPEVQKQVQNFFKEKDANQQLPLQNNHNQSNISNINTNYKNVNSSISEVKDIEVKKKMQDFFKQRDKIYEQN